MTLTNYPGLTPDVILAYDKNNNTTSISTSSAARTLSYDANDKPATEALSIDGLSFALTYTHNAQDLLQSITYPKGRSVTYTPDALGRPTAASPFLTAVTHDLSGQPNKLTYANGQVTDIGYNTRKFVSSIYTRLGVTTAVNQGYTYDNIGNIATLSDLVNSQYSLTLGYDTVDRLTSASSTALGARNVSYGPGGNILTSTLNGTSYSYNYDATSYRLTSINGSPYGSFSYDGYGNVANNGLNAFTYNDASNLTAVTGANPVSFVYDGKNLRARSQKNGINTYEFYALDGKLMGVYSATGAFLKEYVYLYDQQVAMAVDSTLLDSDGDGLSDWHETNTYGTNPNLADSDGDGLGDGAEVNTYGTNPLATDTDGDGLTDGAEVNTHGTNPNLADTDGDGYDDGTEIAQGSDPLDNTSLPIQADGDLNADGIVNIADILLLQRIVLGLRTPSANEAIRGDVAPLVNGAPASDGQLNAGDLVVLHRRVIGLENF
jgi:YD repeat-containing protein